jgi:phenylacetate-CoA ligase
MLDQSPREAQLRMMEPTSSDELAALQLKRLKWSLRHAYDNVAEYRRAFDAKGVHPDDLKTLADLAKFPFTTKQDLRENYPFGFFAVPLEQVSRIHASSGTTGRPTVVGYSRRDIDMWADVMARAMRAAGCRPGMKAHITHTYGLFTGGFGFHYGAERLGCTVIPVSGGMTERQVQLMQDFRPDIVVATPSYMLAILDEFRRAGVDPRNNGMKIAMYGAEPSTTAVRHEIEDAFRIRAFDMYGLTEVIGPGVASQGVETEDALQVWEDHFYPEVVDPATGDVLPPGSRGELVFTSLTKEALPIVRFRTRDISRLLPGTSRPMRLMEKIAGRTDDMIILRGVNVFPTQIEEQILKCAGLAPHYVLEVYRVGRLDSMNVIVEARPNAGAPEYRAQQAKELARHAKSFVGVSISVDVVDPGTMDRTAGKARRVIDKRPKE